MLNKLTNILLMGHQPTHPHIRENFVSALGAFFAILILLAMTQYVASGLTVRLLVLASMGATVFLLFVAPHSPMAQPWPVIGGHLLSAAIGVVCAQWIGSPALAAATAVSLSIFAMNCLRCPHPPSAATAMIAVLGGPEIHAMGWQFCYELVAINVGITFALALVINNMVSGRRYPLLHLHHAHHTEFSKATHQQFQELTEKDFRWALDQMNSFIDVSEEDLVDLYEFAIEHAQSHQHQSIKEVAS